MARGAGARRGRRATYAERSGVWRAVLSLGLVAGVGATGTYAYWTDSVVVTGTTISTGSIDLKVNGSDTVTNFTTMNVAAMAPGHTTAGVLTVSNTGTVPLGYYVDAVGSNVDGLGLAAALTVRVTSAGATAGSAPAVTCPGGALAGSGTAFAAGIVGSAGSPRTLAAGASETLCFEALLPTNAANSLQNASTSVTFTFSGTSS